MTHPDNERERATHARDTGTDAHTVAGELAGVVYGLVLNGEGFGFLDAATAQDEAREVEAIGACTTLGEFRALVPDLQHVSSPVQPDEDEYPFLPDDHPIDLRAFESWPPSHALYGQELLPEAVLDDLIEQECAAVHSTVLDGDYFYVHADRETDLLDILARHGLTARRDDDLISFLC